MKRFLRRLLLFLLPIAAISYPLDRMLSLRLSRIAVFPWEQEVWQDLYGSKAACEVAIYGSSRAWMHFDAPFLERGLGKTVYNFGIDGHNFWFQYVRHLEYLKYNPPPAVILLSLDERTLSSPGRMGPADHWLPYMLWNSNMASFVGPATGSTLGCYLPLLRYAGKSQLIWQSLTGTAPATRHRPKGFKSTDSTWTDALAEMRKQYQDFRVTPDEKVIALLNHFLQTCQDAGIWVILVYSPEQIEGQQFVRNHAAIMALYRAVAAQFGVPLLDYSQDAICFDKRYFYNANHMNTTGVRLFNHQLLKDLRRLFLRPGYPLRNRTDGNAFRNYATGQTLSGRR